MAQYAPLAQQLSVGDPRERLALTLSALDSTIAAAHSRQRSSNGERYADPDGNTITKCIEMAAKLIADYHARCMSSVESIGTLDRAQAIAELEAVLEAWKDPRVTDEQWRASRIAPVVTEKPAVRRGRPPKRQP